MINLYQIILVGLGTYMCMVSLSYWIWPAVEVKS